MLKAKELIVLIPIVIMFMILSQVFELHGLLAAMLSLLTIPFSTVIQMKMHPVKTSIASPEQTRVNIPIQSDEESDGDGVVVSLDGSEEQSKKIILHFWLAAGFIIFTVVVYAVATSPTWPAPPPLSENDVALETIKNPLYLADKTAYSLDLNNEVVNAVFPLQQKLFVEGIKRLETSQMLVLQVSYPTRVADRNIFKVVDLYVPGIVMVTCKENDPTRMYINSQIVGKYVVATVSTTEDITTFYTSNVYAQLSSVENILNMYTDLSEDLVSKGHARVTPSTSIGGLRDYPNATGNSPRRKNYLAGSTSTDITTFNLNASRWFDELESQAQVAKLEKRGSWACIN